MPAFGTLVTHMLPEFQRRYWQLGNAWTESGPDKMLLARTLPVPSPSCSSEHVTGDASRRTGDLQHAFAVLRPTAPVSLKAPAALASSAVLRSLPGAKLPALDAARRLTTNSLRLLFGDRRTISESPQSDGPTRR